MDDQFYEYKKSQDEYRSLNDCYNEIKEIMDAERDNKKPITCDEFLDLYQLERITTGDFGL